MKGVFSLLLHRSTPYPPTPFHPRQGGKGSLDSRFGRGFEGAKYTGLGRLGGAGGGQIVCCDAERSLGMASCVVGDLCRLCHLRPSGLRDALSKVEHFPMQVFCVRTSPLQKCTAIECCVSFPSFVSATAIRLRRAFPKKRPPNRVAFLRMV